MSEENVDIKESTEATEGSEVPAVQGATQVAVASESAVMVDEQLGQIESKDIISPRLLLMNSLSDLVTVKGSDINAGDFVESLAQEVICEEGGTVEFVIVKAWKSWVTMLDNGSGKPKFVCEVPYTATNSNTPRETTDAAGISHKHFETHNFMILLTNDIKEEISFPMTLSFRSTGLMASKAIYSYASKLGMAARISGKKKKPIMSAVFKLSTLYMDNEKGKWYKPTVAKSRPTEKEELRVSKIWADTLSAEGFKVDDEFKEEGAESTATAAPINDDSTMDMDV